MSMHVCCWVPTGLRLEVNGLYAGYVELQQCSDVTCGATQAVKLPRTMPDAAYAAGKLNPHNNCACTTCCRSRKTWR